MKHNNNAAQMAWTVKQALVLAALCLAAGVIGGWGIRAAQRPAANAPVITAAATDSANVAAGVPNTPMPNATQMPSATQMPTAVQMKQMADEQAEPLVEKLAANPGNAELLINLGNLYYDAHQYPTAVDYYARALKSKPEDAAVRTDMGTAYWFMGNADTAITEFNKALSYAPANPNTLFNRGMVKWQGKKDAVGAIADWEQLLKADPNYDGRAQVEKMMADAKRYAAANSGGAAK